MGAARWTFNACISSINEKTSKINKQQLREKFITKVSKNLDPTVKDWIFDTPYDIRDYALADLIQAYDVNLRKGEKFTKKYRTKKDKQQQFTSKRGDYAFLKDIKTSEKLPDICHDFRIMRTRLGKFYFCLPIPLDFITENQGNKITDEDVNCGKGIIAMDPGVRTFQTTFDGEGTITEWGNHDIQKIINLCHLYDDLQSRWSQKNVRHKQRYRMKKVALTINLRIRNLIDDCHKKMAKWLCENYRIILLPHFETSRMVKKRYRKITSETARSMLTWAHYRFKQRVLFKATEYPSCQVLLVDESYTSRTCGSCGAIHPNLGKNKTFKCPSCGWSVDRDVNGARNILIRFLTKLSNGKPWW